MRILVPLESVLGILWLGLLVGTLTSQPTRRKNFVSPVEQKEDAMNKIIGSLRVEKIKEQILRAFVTQRDLSYCNQIIEYLIQHLNNSDDIIVESLTTNAVVSYSRCFHSEFSYSLSPDIFDEAVPSSRTEGQVSERQFHYLIMNYRNKHIAHSDNFLKAMVVGATRINGQYAVGPITAIRVLKEDENFYVGIAKLATKAREVVSERLGNLQQKLIELLQSGEATLSNEEAILTPIPLNISPQELWGLSER